MPPKWTRKPGGRRVRVRKGNSGIPAPTILHHLSVCNTVPSSRDNHDEDDDEDDNDDGDNGTGMCYTLSSCRPGRLVSK